MDFFVLGNNGEKYGPAISPRSMFGYRKEGFCLQANYKALKLVRFQWQAKFQVSCSPKTVSSNLQHRPLHLPLTRRHPSGLHSNHLIINNPVNPCSPIHAAATADSPTASSPIPGYASLAACFVAQYCSTLSESSMPTKRMQKVTQTARCHSTLTSATWC